MIIGLTGYAGSGKDTVGQMFVSRGYDRESFADQVRALAHTLDPWIKGPVRTEHGVAVFPGYTKLSTIVRTMGWQQAKVGSMEIRQLLQALGQGARDVLNDQVWITDLLRGLDPAKDDIVITDVRYRNESAAIRLAGGRVYRVDRPGVGPINNHPTETEVSRVVVDGVIDNSFDLPHLDAQVAEIVEHYRALEVPNR